MCLSKSDALNGVADYLQTRPRQQASGMAVARSRRKDFLQSTTHRRRDDRKKTALAPTQLGRQRAELLLLRNVPHAAATTTTKQLSYTHHHTTSFNPHRRPRRPRRPNNHHRPPIHNPLCHNPASKRHKHRHANGRTPPLPTHRNHSPRRRGLRKRARRPLAPQPSLKQMGNHLSTQTPFAARAIPRRGAEHRLLLFQLCGRDRCETSTSRSRSRGGAG